MRKRVIVPAVAAAIMVTGAGVAAADDERSFLGRDARSGHLTAVGLVDGTTLVRFSTGSPQNVKPIGKVGGLTGGDRWLVGIDYRVQDGKLYGVGDKGGIYTLSTRSAAATFVQRLTVGLEGTRFGVDFNPAANALRIVGDTGQNLRQPFATPNAPTVADTRLSTPPTAGDTAGVTAAAYTNNDLAAATGTTLFDLNTAGDAVVVQAPANAGTLSATGSLGVDAGSDAGLDIYSVVRDGVATKQRAYAVLTVGGTPGLYGVDLLTGRAVKAGRLGAKVTDLAIPLAQR